MATKKKETPRGKAPAAAKTSAAPKGGAKTAAPKGGAKAAAPKPAPKVKAPPVVTGPRHPRGRLTAAHGSKEALAKQIAASIVGPDDDADAIAARLRTASNRQLLRLAAASETVKKKWGSREKLIAAIGAAQKKGKDQDFLTKLETYSLPQLVDLARSAERRARA
ncbi:MAG TPA: hypothetical protein VNO30_26745 [Kofleriaceae bacterium]|nr:hypothetical protein [Kofleriaceae bacterium]